jgi:hypothetical protein
MSDYNNWTNRETWLVNMWYMDRAENQFADAGLYHVEPSKLKATITFMCQHYEEVSFEPVGLVADFMSGCWSRVNWHELADHLNETLNEMEKENESIDF